MSPEGSPGAFVAVVGPSGAGKDTLMSRAALHPALDPRVRFAKRVVTRAALVTSEDHDSLDEAGFDRAQARGAFALVWAAHGLRYGLPETIRREVARGLTVVANLSRRSLAEASETFGALHVVEVTARPEILQARLSARGRETEATILERLRRHVPIDGSAAADVLQIDNSGDAASATDVLVRYLGRLAATPR